MPEESTSLELSCDLAELERFYEVTDTFAARTGLDPSTVFGCKLIVEELFTNVLKYGMCSLGDPTPVASVTLLCSPQYLTLEFKDRGEPFDASSEEAPEGAIEADSLKVGGLGLLLIHQRASSIDYERTEDGKNRLTLTLPREPSQ